MPNPPSSPPLSGSSSDVGWLHAVFAHAALGIALVDMEGRLVRVNPALERMIGYTAEELREITFVRLTHPEDLSRDRDQLRALLRGQREEYQVENRYLRKDGQAMWGHLTVSLLRDSAGEPEYALALVTNVTERKWTEGALEHERAYLEQLFESSPAGLALVDPEDRVLRVNSEFMRLFGYTAEEAVGRTVQELIVSKGQEREALSITRRVARGERVRLDTVRRHKDGSPVDVSVQGVPITLHGDQIAVYGIYQDITERKGMEQALRRLSTTDVLTGALNRRGFESVAEREWVRARRTQGDLVLFYVDLDGFKQVNDTHGHGEGDQLLQDVAELLRRTFRASDVIARLGGDEFVVLAVDAGDEIEAVVEGRLRAAVEAFNRREAREYALALSVGAHRTSAASSLTLTELLAEADGRMYQQKRLRQRPPR
jgi:diguanylate cyclase (GGDEF)-like protein/PAS domain S-box-containing protein